MSIEVNVNQFEGGVSAYRNPTAHGTADYLYWLCGKFGLQAQAILNIAGGGQVAPISSSVSIYPFIITSDNFEPDGVSYNDSRIVGDRVMIFINEWSQQWFDDASGAFQYTATGIKILLQGFDAETADYTIVIQKDNSI